MRSSICLIIFVIQFLIENEGVPYLKIHNGTCSGGMEVFGLHLYKDQPDLSATAKYFGSPCYHSSGVWAVYLDAENYGKITTDTRLYIGGSTYYAGVSSPYSARLVGERGSGAPRKLSLYNGVDYTNTATAITADQPVLSVNFNSLILLGPQSVQLYLQQNYAGFSYCVVSNGEYSWTTIKDISSIGLSPGDVRSLRFNCTSSATLIGDVHTPAENDSMALQ